MKSADFKKLTANISEFVAGVSPDRLVYLVLGRESFISNHIKDRLKDYDSDANLLNAACNPPNWSKVDDLLKSAAQAAAAPGNENPGDDEKSSTSDRSVATTDIINSYLCLTDPEVLFRKHLQQLSELYFSEFATLVNQSPDSNLDRKDLLVAYLFPRCEVPASDPKNFECNTSSMRKDIRSFLRCLTLEAMMEERNFSDYKSLCSSRVQGVLAAARREKEHAKEWKRFSDEVARSLCEVYTQSKEVPHMARFSKYFESSPETWNMDQEFLNKHIVCTGQIEKFFHWSQSDRPSSAALRRLFEAVDEKFGTWVRRIFPGIVAFIGSMIIATLLAVVMSSIFPTQLWFWLGLFVSLIVGWIVYFKRREDIKAQITKFRLQFAEFDEEHQTDGSIARIFQLSANELQALKYDVSNVAEHVAKLDRADKRRLQFRKFSFVQRAAASVLLAIVVIGIGVGFISIFVVGKYNNDAYLIGSNQGTSCFLDFGAVVWSGPGDYVVFSAEHTTQGARAFSIIKQSAVNAVMQGSLFSSRRVPESCSTLLDRDGDTNPTSPSVLLDARSTVRSFLVAFPGNVDGCTSDDWKVLDKRVVSGARLSNAAVESLQHIASALTSCSNGRKPVVDVMGFSSENRGACLYHDRMNLDLAEYRRFQVLKELGAKLMGGTWVVGGGAFELDNAAEKRWGGSINAMTANRSINNKDDNASRYVEVKIVGGAGCFGL